MHCKWDTSTTLEGEAWMNARLPMFFPGEEVEAKASSRSSSEVEEELTQMKRREPLLEVELSPLVRNLSISAKLVSSVTWALRWRRMEDWMYSSGEGGLPILQ